MEYKILDWTFRCGTICIAAVEYGEYWQAYIGDIRKIVVLGNGSAVVIERNEDDGVRHVIDWGDKLSYKEAWAFFPNLPISKYKTYLSEHGEQ